MFSQIHQALDPARDQAKAYMEAEGHKPRMFSDTTILSFFGNIPSIAGILREEPEVLLFAAFQWIAVWLAYLAWTQMLQWIPDGVWNAVETGSRSQAKGMFTLINLALLAWSFFVVAVVSYPIGLCNAAMVAVHDLRASKEKVTLARCLVVADKHLGKIWMFTVVDAWITVTAILDRLPKKHYHRTALDEFLYYAWKCSTMAVVPALINGRDFVAAGKDSVKLLTTQPLRAFGLRLGYSAVCWVVGVLAYVGSIIYFCQAGSYGREAHFVYNFYFLMGAPIFVTVGVISVAIRPFFLLGVAKLYTDSVDVKEEIDRDIQSVPTATELLLSWKVVLFALMATTLCAAVFIPDELGIREFVERLGAKDLAHFYQHFTG